jgi:hypothetical protein
VKIPLSQMWASGDAFDVIVVNGQIAVVLANSVGAEESPLAGVA